MNKIHAYTLHTHNTYYKHYTHTYYTSRIPLSTALCCSEASLRPSSLWKATSSDQTDLPPGWYHSRAYPPQHTPEIWCCHPGVRSSTRETNQGSLKTSSGLCLEDDILDVVRLRVLELKLTPSPETTSLVISTGE